MLRVIKYYNTFNSDGAQFSNSSTNYEVLPYIFENTAGIAELKAVAKELGLKTRGAKTVDVSRRAKYGGGFQDLTITHALNLVGKIKHKHREEEYSQYLGLIIVPEAVNGLKAAKRIDRGMTRDQVRAIRDAQAYGFYDVVDLDSKPTIVMQSWDYGHGIKLLGYSLTKFEKLLGTDEHVFDDSVSSCEECGEWDYNDNGYNYNFKSVPGEDYGHYGVNCGCFKEACVSNLENFINDADVAMEEEIAQELESSGKIEAIEEQKYTSDDRATRLKKAQERFKDGKFIFGDSYRSVTLYRIADTPKVIRVL